MGLKFYLGYEEYSADDERLHQLYEYCEKHNVPIMFHTGVLEAAVRVCSSIRTRYRLIASRLDFQISPLSWRIWATRG